MRHCYQRFAHSLGQPTHCHLLHHLDAYNHQIKAGTASVIFWHTSTARKIQWRGKIMLILFTQRAKIPQQQRFHIFRQGGRAQWNKTFPLGRSHGAGTENTEERDRRTHSVYHAFFVLVKRKVGQCQSVRKKYKTHQKTRVISRLLTNSLPR